MTDEGVEFAVDPHIEGCGRVRIEVFGFIDEVGPQLSLTLVDPALRDAEGRDHGELYSFHLTDMDRIGAFFRDVEIARQQLPPHLRSVD